MSTSAQSHLPATQHKRSATKVTERLPPVSDKELLRFGSSDIDPPHWLHRLKLPASRHNIGCLKTRTRVVKRLLDLMVASGLLVLSLPLLAIAIVAIKLTSPGPAFFSQIRVGLNQRRAGSGNIQSCRRRTPSYGKPFRIYKLRTMHVAADRLGPNQVQSGDQRVTCVGKFLRKMRIDELPQLINVLRGEMSMVGPRPECIEYMEELSEKIPNYLQRLGLKPGLTGIAQIEAGYANDLRSYQKKVAYDLIYLQNCCVWNDLRTMARTVKVVLTGFGAL